MFFIKVVCVNIGNRRLEIFRVGQSIGSNRPSVRDSQRSVIFEFGDNSLAVLTLSIYLEFHVFGDNSDYTGF